MIICQLEKAIDSVSQMQWNGPNTKHLLREELKDSEQRARAPWNEINVDINKRNPMLVYLSRFSELVCYLGYQTDCQTSKMTNVRELV